MKTFIALVGIGAASAQSDGNPHNWDRLRRCDHVDYDPPCEACEGYGGIPYGDDNDDIILTSCEIVANASSIDPSTLVKPVWGVQWEVSRYYEVLIGPKLDPFCFSVIPSNSSEGELCYRADYGAQYSDATLHGGALRIDLNAKSIVGNITSTVLHEGTNFWIVNKFPWYALGVQQCVCTQVQQGSDPTTPLMYPIQYNWTDQLFFVGREEIGVEYTGETQVLDHWAFGPHHAWSDPNTGATIRMWQPYNGLQVFPHGTVENSTLDPNLFPSPPPECKKEGGVKFRINCDDDGFYDGGGDDTAEPVKSLFGSGNTEAEVLLSERDAERARQVVPRDDYKGHGFEEMSSVLNGWLEEHASGVGTRPCESFNVTELRQLQAMLFLARDARLDQVYVEAEDNRRIRRSRRRLSEDKYDEETQESLLQDLQEDWAELDHALASFEESGGNDGAQQEVEEEEEEEEMVDLTAVHRDGHCHEAVMWFVHHLREDVQNFLALSGVEIPLLAPTRHTDACRSGRGISSGGGGGGLGAESSASAAQRKVCTAYEEQVTCSSCHSQVTPPS